MKHIKPLALLLTLLVLLLVACDSIEVPPLSQGDPNVPRVDGLLQSSKIYITNARMRMAACTMIRSTRPISAIPTAKAQSSLVSKIIIFLTFFKKGLAFWISMCYNTIRCENTGA